MRLPILALSAFVSVMSACGSSRDGEGPAAPASSAPALLSIKPGFALAEADGIARGDAAQPPCKGAFPATPSVRLELFENMAGVIVEVRGEALALHVRQGRNDFCGKLEGDAVRVGRGAWGKGEYEVFVGTTDGAASRPFKLRVVESPR